MFELACLLGLSLGVDLPASLSLLGIPLDWVLLQAFLPPTFTIMVEEMWVATDIRDLVFPWNVFMFYELDSSDPLQMLLN